MIRVYLMDMGRKLFALTRGLAFGALFVSLWTWFVPRWLAGVRLHPQSSAAAITLMTIGGTVMLWCVIAFGWRGLGTLAPFDPPRRLVVSRPVDPAADPFDNARTEALH